MFTLKGDIAAKIKDFWAEHPEVRLPRDTVRALCPSCADKMEAKGLSALILRQDGMSPEAVAGLCDSLGGAEGFFDRCMGHDFGDFQPADKEAFCAWLHNECLGKFPSQESLTDYDRWFRDAELKELSDYRKGVAPAPLLYRQSGSVQKAPEGDLPFLFLASEESEDRTGWVISTSGWQTDAFQKNPVFLFCHDQSIPPIGTVPKIWTESKQLLANVRFDDEDEFARLIKGKYQRRIMRAVSVGFRALEFEDRRTAKGTVSGILFKRQELIELSAVPVPANPAALQRILAGRPNWSVPSEAFIKRLEELEKRVGQIEPAESIDLVAISHQYLKAKEGSP